MDEPVMPGVTMNLVKPGAPVIGTASAAVSGAVLHNLLIYISFLFWHADCFCYLVTGVQGE